MPDPTSSLFSPSITLKTCRTERAAKQQLPLTEGETAAPSGCSDWLRCKAWESCYWQRGDTPLESVYVQPEIEEGWLEEGDIRVGCDCDGVGWRVWGWWMSLIVLKQKGRDLGGGGVTCTLWETSIGACSKPSRKLGCLFAL